MRSRSYTASQDAVARQVGDETIIVPVRGDVAELEAIFTTNEVGGFIWQQLRTPQTLEQLAEAVCREFSVASSTAAADVREFISALIAARLVCEVETEDTGGNE